MIYEKNFRIGKCYFKYLKKYIRHIKITRVSAVSIAAITKG